MRQVLWVHTQFSSREHLTLADARQLAREALRDAALGHDPASGKREAREALTVTALVKDYIESGEGRRSPATNGDYRRTLKAVVQDSPLGHQAAQQVARGELRAFLEIIARKTPIRANRVLALVRAAFRWGLREELIERDPTAGLQRLRPERPRERVLADEEIKRLWGSMDVLAAGTTDPVLENGKKAPRLVVAGAVKLLLLLGTRRSETLNMRWSDIDERARSGRVGELRGDPRDLRRHAGRDRRLRSSLRPVAPDEHQGEAGPRPSGIGVQSA